MVDKDKHGDGRMGSKAAPKQKIVQDCLWGAAWWACVEGQWQSVWDG